MAVGVPFCRLLTMLLTGTYLPVSPQYVQVRIMNIVARRPFGQNYAFVVVGVIFLSLLAAAGLRASPGGLIFPLESAFGWSRATTSFAAASGILLYGMVGPFAAALMQTFGVKRTLLCALALMS